MAEHVMAMMLMLALVKRLLLENQKLRRDEFDIMGLSLGIWPNKYDMLQVGICVFSQLFSPVL